MNLLRRFGKTYLTGVKWSNEFVAQRTYNMAVIIEILFMISTAYIYSNVLSVALIIHMLSIYFVGYKKNSWEGSSLQGSNKERIYQILYFVINILIIFVSIIITKSFYILLLILIPSLCAAIYVFIHSCSYILLDRFYKYLYIFNIYTILLNVITLSVFLFIFDVEMIKKIIILVVYTLTIPIVNVAEDNGMNFYGFYSCM